MDFELTLEQQRVQEQARRFAREEVAPRAREADETGTFPWQLVPRMAELGFLAGPLEPEYGGTGMDYMSYALMLEELGWADSSVRGFLTVHIGLVSLCIRAWGTDEQKRRYLPRLASGECIGCYCLTEPDAGSDVASSG
jgi:alkylation response protein AidB-like acyl-CoA dehydrogenase